MEKKPNRRSRLTKRIIREALFELMQEKPFAQITVKDICQQADLNRTTFYLHYHNLDALLHEIEQNAYTEVSNYIRSIHAGNNKVHQIKLLLEYIRQNHPLFQILLLGNEVEYRDRFLQYFQGMLIEENGPAEQNEFSEYTKAFIINGCSGLVNAWIDDDFRISSELLAEWLYSICDGASRSIRNNMTE